MPTSLKRLVVLPLIFSLIFAFSTSTQSFAVGEGDEIGTLIQTLNVTNSKLEAVEKRLELVQAGLAALASTVQQGVNFAQNEGGQFLERLQNIGSQLQSIAYSFGDSLPSIIKMGDAAKSLSETGEVAIGLAQQDLPEVLSIGRTVASAMESLQVVTDFVAAHPVELGVGVVTLGFIALILGGFTVKHLVSCDRNQNIIYRGCSSLWHTCRGCFVKETPDPFYSALGIDARDTTTAFDENWSSDPYSTNADVDDEEKDLRGCFSFKGCWASH